MNTREETFRNQVLPDYEPLFQQNADEVRNAPVKILTKILSAYWLKILFSSLLFVIKASAAWALPYLTSDIINTVTSGTDNASFIIIRDFTVMVLLVMMNIPVNYIYTHYTNSILRNIGAGMRNTLVKKLQHLSITYHKEIESGRLQSKFLRDVEAIEFFNSHLLKTIIPAALSALCMGCIAFSQSRVVALFYVVILPVNIILVRIFRKKMRSNNHTFRKENENMSANVSTMIEMIPVTKAHGLENEEIAKLEENIRNLKLKGLVLDKTISYFGSLSWGTSMILRGICLMFTSFLALNGKISVGSIVMFESYFVNILNNVQNIVTVYPELSKGIESVRSVSEILLSDDIENNRGKTRMRSLKGNIEFENVSYRYPGAEENVINNLSLKVNAGDCVAFVGASGSGKSTIMNMIIGFLLPDSGSLRIDGNPVEKLNLSDYRHHISVVPQSSILFKGTIKENILYGTCGISDRKLERIIESANINEFLKELPHGINTVVGEHGDKLSGGQKQRISIARALIRDPKILILDEATSALDNISEHHVQEAISTLIKGRTTFIVAHRLSTIRNADKIVVMDKGRIVETGTYNELMEKKGYFYELKKLNETVPAVK